MSGFPNRPGLLDFGPETLVDSRAIRNPKTELGAAFFGLVKSQLAGLGVVAPRAFLSFSASPSPAVLARSEAWNPKALTSAPFANPTLTRAATGSYNVVYTSPVTDAGGAAAALSFAFGGLGWVTTASLTVRKTVQVTPLSGTPNGVKVAVFDTSGALVDGNNVAILIF
jgi:hypothetical protein